jgi:hypothetical protein
MKNAFTPCCRITSASLIALAALNASAALVFQADFNGPGAGTGGVSDIVALGGTGALTNIAPNISNIVVSVSSLTALGAGTGSYLSLNDQAAQSGTRVAGVEFKPEGAANSFDSWYADTSATLGHDTLNGGFDFLFRTSSGEPLVKDTVRFVDVGASGVPYRLALSSTDGDKLSLAINQSGINIARATSAAVKLSAGTTYRIAGTVSTNASGFVTVNLYLAKGNAAIDTGSPLRRIATSTSSVKLDAGNSISGAFGTAGGFYFGMMSNVDADTKTLDLDSFRIYDAVPASFDADSIPKPGSMDRGAGER